MHQDDDPGVGRRQAVIVCGHVFHRRAPVRCAIKDEPDPNWPADSGWQLLCWTDVQEDIESAAIISVEEALVLVPELAAILAAPAGTQWLRAGAALHFSLAPEATPQPPRDAAGS